MDLEVLIKSNNPLIAVETIEEARLEEIIKRLAWRLSLPLYTWDCHKGLCRSGQDKGIYQTQEPFTALSAVGEIESGIFFFKDLAHYLDDHKVQRQLKNITSGFPSQKAILFVSSSSEYPRELREILVDYPMPLPTKEQMKGILKRFLDASPQIKSVLTAQETNRVLENLRGLTAFEVERALSQAVVADKALSRTDFKMLANIKKRFVEKNSLVEYISPEDSLAVVGGLTNLKQWISKRKKAFIDPASSLPSPKGVLLIGVPGCGKTLCARAIATELGVGLIKVDPGKLYSKYIGESEANLRQVLKMAESLAPVVLLVDEVEKVLPTTDSGTSDGGLSKRLFGTFLSWLQDKTAPVFVVATSNNIRALPPEFSRKGRFDEIFFVDLPDAGARKVIFEIHLKRHDVDPATIKINELVELTEGFSGAEIEELILSSLFSVASGVGNISTEIIKAELSNTIPLSQREEERVAELRRWAATRTIKA